MPFSLPRKSPLCHKYFDSCSISWSRHHSACPHYSKKREERGEVSGLCVPSPHWMQKLRRDGVTHSGWCQVHGVNRVCPFLHSLNGTTGSLLVTFSELQYLQHTGMPSSYLPYLLLLQITQNVLKNNWITANQIVMFSHCTRFTELILKRFHAYSRSSLQLNITNFILFKRLNSCPDIHVFPLAALGVECLKFWCRVACREGRTRSVSHAEVQVLCTVTIILVSAPVHKWSYRQPCSSFLTQPGLHWVQPLLRKQPHFSVSLCSILCQQLSPPVVQTLTLLKLQVGFQPCPKADFGKIQNFWKRRGVRVEQMFSALCKQCSSRTPVNIPSHCLAATPNVTALPLCSPSSFHMQLPSLTITQNHFTPLKWWKSFQILLFPHTHLGGLSVCRSPPGPTRCVSRRGSGWASPGGWWHVTALPLHTQPAPPSALSAASLHMLH